jgi:hypothetical protein
MAKMLTAAEEVSAIGWSGTFPSKAVIEAAAAPMAVVIDTRCGALRHIAFMVKKKAARAAGFRRRPAAAICTPRPNHNRRFARSGRPSGKDRLFHK